MKNSSGKWCVAIGFLMLSLAANMMFCNSGQAAAVAKIGTSFVAWSAQQWPDYVATEKGFYKEQGLEVNLIGVKSNPEIIQLMIGGDAPFATGDTTDSMLLALQKGFKVKGLMAKGIAAPYDLVVSGDIKNYSQLKGKKFAVSALKSASTIMLKVVLAANGLKEGDYQLLVVGGNDSRLAALRQGGVQGAVLNPPANFIAEKGGMRVLDHFTKYVAHYDFVSIAASEKYIQANPQVVQKLVTAYLKALDWLAKPGNRVEAEAILAKVLKIDREIAQKSYQYFMVDNRIFSPKGDPSPEAYGEMIKAMKTLELLDKPIALGDYYDLTYLRKAQKELGLTK